MKQEFLVTTLAQDRVGLLSRVAMVFSRRRINIESCKVAESAMKGIAAISMVVRTDARTIKQVVKQLEKQVEVLQAFSAEQPDVSKQIENQLHFAS